MSEPAAYRLSDIVWGGRVRPAHQWEIRDIAQRAAHTTERSVRGNMVSSAESVTFHFLDGGLREERGWFGPQSGMRWFGVHAIAHMLYELGQNPQELLRIADLPSKEQLRETVRLDAEAERARRKSSTH